MAMTIRSACDRKDDLVAYLYDDDEAPLLPAGTCAGEGNRTIIVNSVKRPGEAARP